MNEMKDYNSFDKCSTKNMDKGPCDDPNSYAVNIAGPGPVYLAPGAGGQCKQGWRIAVNVQEFHVSSHTQILNVFFCSGSSLASQSSLLWGSPENCLKGLQT